MDGCVVIQPESRSIQHQGAYDHHHHGKRIGRSGVCVVHDGRDGLMVRGKLWDRIQHPLRASHPDHRILVRRVVSPVRRLAGFHDLASQPCRLNQSEYLSRR